MVDYWPQGERQLQGFQKEVDEIGSLLVGTVQQVNERNEQVPDMLKRLDNLNAECALFQTIQEAKMSEPKMSEPKVSEPMLSEPKVSKRRSSSTGTSKRFKILLGTSVAIGVIFLILICILANYLKGEEKEELVKASAEWSSNVTQPGP